MSLYRHRRASAEWLQAPERLGTGEHKLSLETAPWLIAVVLKRFEKKPDGTKIKHYYTDESVGTAVGILIAALHQCGLSTLTHPTSPMGFRNEVLGRPKDTERPLLLLVVGHAKPGTMVPDQQRKGLEEIAVLL